MGAAGQIFRLRNAQTAPALQRAGWLALLGLLSAVAPAFPDSWSLPTRASYPSESGAFVLVVSPKKLSSQLDYFEDKVDGRANAGGVPGLRENAPRAELFQVGPDRRRKRISKFPLVNEVAPVSALVSDDGRWVVTFDNWHTVGLGDSVIVIYRSDGSLVRSLSLEELLLDEDLEELPRSVSSRSWSKGMHIESASARLVLEISRCDLASNCLEKPGVLEIDLSDGSLVGPKRQLVPRAVGRVTLSEPAQQEWLRVGQRSSCGAGTDGVDGELHTFVAFDDLRPVDLGLETPKYTMLGWKARIQGTVVLDLDVSRDGSVDCVEIVRGLPMGLAESARSAALGWQLRAGATKARTRVALNFRRGEEPVPLSEAARESP